jgi:hypothetical protein
MRTYDKLIATIPAAKAGDGLRARFGWIGRLPCNKQGMPRK